LLHCTPPIVGALRVAESRSEDRKLAARGVAKSQAFDYDRAMQPSNDARGALPAPFEARVAGVACVLACLALALAGWFPVNNPDSFGHLAQGRQIAELGRVPLRDSFSFWQPQPAVWHNYEWLSDIATYRLYELGGYDALIAAKCLLLLVSAALLIGLAQLLGGTRVAVLCAVLIVAAIPAARFRLTERPHLVALPFCTFYLIGFSYLLRAFGKAKARVDTLFIVTIGVAHVLWVNLHGSHLLGLLLTLLCLGFALGLPEARRKLSWVLGLQLVASCISPYGPAIVIDAIKHVVDPAYRLLVSEWEPWQPSDPLWLLLAPIVQTLGLASVARPLSRSGAAGRALLSFNCLLALSGFRSIRFVAEYLLLSAPAIAFGLSAVLRPIDARKLVLAVTGAFCIAAYAVPWAAAWLPPFAPIGHGMRSVGLPAASGQWLAEHGAHPRVLAAIEDSWYLMFAVPQARFLVDGRVPFYGPAHIRRVRLAFASQRRLDELIEHFGIDTIVVRHTFKPHRLLLDGMRSRDGWALVTVEDRYALFVRDDIPLLGGGRPRVLALQPSYEPDWLLDADAKREPAILSALAELPKHENNRGYRGWIRAVLAIKPLQRAGRGNGLRPPANAAETAVLKKAAAWLRRAATGAEGVPVVHAYHALVAAALCDLDMAEAALEEARWEGESRETLLGAQEIALRRGQRQEVEEFLRKAQALPGAAGDTWLAALRQGLSAPPRCP
jgi:hypothetical protein